MIIFYRGKGKYILLGVIGSFIVSVIVSTIVFSVLLKIDNIFPALALTGALSAWVCWLIIRSDRKNPPKEYINSKTGQTVTVNNSARLMFLPAQVWMVAFILVAVVSLGVFIVNPGAGDASAYATPEPTDIVAVAKVTPTPTVTVPNSLADFDGDPVAFPLLGEWDGGSMGYFVFKADGELDRYKDSSKSTDNVFTYNYIYKDYLSLAGGGTADGLDVIVTYTSSVASGVSHPEAVGTQDEWAFVRNDDGSYSAHGLVNDSYFTLNKVE